jgi:hypothetical protein
MTIKSITPKNQTLVNKAVKWLVKHNEYNTKRDLISDNLDCEEYDSKEWRQINRKCETSFDKYLEYIDELPKREVKNIEKSELY